MTTASVTRSCAHCAECGQSYSPVRSYQRYCSGRCRVAAWRKTGESWSPTPARRGPLPTVHVDASERFGFGVVIDPEVRRHRRGAILSCDCGKTYWAPVSDLKDGSVSSCGCRKNELKRASKLGPANPNFKHGLRRTHPLYSTWKGMLNRCENPDSRSYGNYGGRGISVYPDWHDVTAGVAWIDAKLGPRPEGCSLDRIDNDGNYEPGNVRWATALQQAGNRRTRRLSR